MNGEKFLGNKSKRELHDLDNEKPQCYIDEIIQCSNEIPFNFVFEAKHSGFDNCAYCIGKSAK